MIVSVDLLGVLGYDNTLFCWYLISRWRETKYGNGSAYIKVDSSRLSWYSMMGRLSVKVEKDIKTVRDFPQFMATDGWKESFKALLDAYESFDQAEEKPKLERKQTGTSLSISDSSSMQSEELLRTQKRKKSFSNEDSRVKVQITGLKEFCWQFEDAIVLAEHDRGKIRDECSISKRQVFTSQPKLLNHISFSSNLVEYLHSLAAQEHVSVQEIKNLWLSKKAELESNISILVHGQPTDNYDDLKSIAGKIQDTASWLSGDNLEELGNLVPSWKTSEHRLKQIMYFTNVVEDLRTTSLPQPTEHVQGTIENIIKFVMRKRQLYGNLLRNDMIAWRVLGFPVNDINHCLSIFRDQLYVIVWNALVRVWEYANKPIKSSQSLEKV
jgi:hypothetical protein